MLHAPILTPRLRLELFDESTWRHFADGRPGWPAHLRYSVSDPHVLPSARYARGRLGQLTANPARHPWMARAIVREADAVMIGHINFHHPPPDPDLAAWTTRGFELGYEIGVDHRRLGFATEAIRGMVSWATTQAGPCDVILSIDPANTASLGLARKLGFLKIDERMDEEDGLEWVLKTDTTALLASAPR